MKKGIVFMAAMATSLVVFAQKKKSENIISDSAIIATSSEAACKCIDSIPTYNKSKLDIANMANDCIDKQVMTYQMMSKLTNSMGSLEDMLADNKKKKKGKTNEIIINTNTDAAEYKKYYYDLERDLMANCQSLQTKIASSDLIKEKSLSKNPLAMLAFSQALDAANDTIALDYYKKAVEKDANFVFAWDNLGLTYRKLRQYDKAIHAYQQSLNIDPNNEIPLQNLAVVYIHIERYEEAIKTYEKMALLSPNNPEVFYGLGHVYANFLNENEKGLDNICKAYNLYTQQKSPYRTDAESIMSAVYHKMKKAGKEKKFYSILKDNNIEVND